MERNLLLDISKVILAILVVGAHCNFLMEYSRVFHFLCVYGIFRITVPIFFIINGYFFIEVIRKNRFKKWIWRVISLYLIWMLIYLPYWARLDNFHLGRFINILITPGYQHLWYLNAMIFSGLLLFSLKRASTKTLIGIASVLFFFGATIQYIKNYSLLSTNLFNDISTYRNFVFFGLPFLIIGYLIRQNKNLIKISKKKLIFLLTICSLIFLLEVIANYFFMPILKGFDIYFSLLFICPVLFYCTIKFKLSTVINNKNLALYSTSIYLVHPLVIILIVSNTSLSPTWVTFLTILLSTLFSFFIIKLNKRIRIL